MEIYIVSFGIKILFYLCVIVMFLCTIPHKTGRRQYHAFLLLKALQTVGQTYEIRRRLRATRADPNSPASNSNCRLVDLVVSLEKYSLTPNSASINNCHGSCNLPVNNINNHAILLHSHIANGNVQERHPCCVPVAYGPLSIVEMNDHGTNFILKQDVVAMACGCR